MLPERLMLIADLAHAARVGPALAALPRGTALVQLRDKTATGKALCAAAEALRRTTRELGARLVVNDRVDVALAAGADGVHLPEGGLPVAAARDLLGPGALVGVSTHGARAAAARAAEGADLILLGPVWDTPSKRAHGAPLGLEAIRDAAGPVGETALFAVGGIESPGRAAEARSAGAHGVAVIRAVLEAPDPALAAKSLVSAIMAPR